MCIALEHPIKIDKAASALVTGVLCWTIFVIFSDLGYYKISKELQYHLIHISEILFFLLGAMTIVELVDAHRGFSIITDRIKTTDKMKLLWIISILSFFFSAVLFSSYSLFRFIYVFYVLLCFLFFSFLFLFSLVLLLG